MKEVIRKFFAPGNFIPYGHCDPWPEGLVWLHILSDTLIALAYYSIPLMLLCFVYKRQDVPFKSLFWLFGAFMVASGTTHILSVWMIWQPNYWLSGSFKAFTAIVSLYLAALVFPLIPKVLALPSPAELEATNQKLEREIMEREQAEADLKESEALFRSIFEGASIGIEIIDLTGQTVARNSSLQQMLGYSKNPKLHPSKDEEPDDELKMRKRSRHQIDNRYLFWERDRYQMEKRYLCKDGQLMWCHVTGYLVRDNTGYPQFGIRMVEDVTEHKQALKQLQHYQKRLEDMVGERTAFLAKANEQLSWEATHDALTGLINRREFEHRLESALAGARNHNQQHTLCYLDLDRFKIVNDTCGHAAGDELLRQISALLHTHVRHTDVLGRLGGDEFALLLYNCSVKQGLQLAHLLLTAIQTFRFVWQDKTFSLGVSIGVVPFTSPLTYGDALLQSVEKVLCAADAACYQAKNSGRNCVHLYQPDDEELAQQREQKQWIDRINQAVSETALDRNQSDFSHKSELADNKFCLYYQPIISLSSHQFVREYYEVLLRLVDEKGEVIPPMAFLPSAERYNLMPTIDRWVIGTLFGILAQQSWEMQSCSLYAINLSIATVNDERFINFLKDQFSLHKILPQSICFEISESVAIANLIQTTKLILSLKALGCRIALDDFGSGISSFAYLKQLPLDYLKISGNLIEDVLDDTITSEMVKAINKISHVMNIQTIATFVKNDSILEKVTSMGIDYAQGYGISAPHPVIFRPSRRYEETLLQRRCS
ncbi:bifunctional diguanylate cyclase/phosphodiesterase [Argonema antarcticum]|uniref:bifunctional diguanylate cyclase/phosphodiesterase n=1 Tax=Argonema antarcticum TaxID=2942763 RepID=UPI0020132A2E|nr:EAL domain-containing protein [Argonema antarcticum]MCL1473028.1 EAL domain-containing protein [Argonema antarcticum A004/B2]